MQKTVIADGYAVFGNLQTAGAMRIGKHRKSLLRLTLSNALQNRKLPNSYLYNNSYRA